MKVIIASNNKHKVDEIQKILRPFGFETYSLSESGIDVEIDETGTTFEENSMIKARAILDMTGEITLADDSGLIVDYLGGAPGVYSARYAGDDASYDDNNKKLVRELDGVPEEKRSARFVSVITMLFPDGREIVARGEVEGVIGTKELGSNGFGYDPLFIVPEKSCTFAELTESEKNSISHRARALVSLRKSLEKK